MKIVISPAKSLDFESQLPTLNYTEYQFAKQTLTIDKVLKKQKPKQLMELMSISDKLADLNWQRNQERNVADMTVENARQAIYAFNGDVYIGLDAYSLSEEKINIAWFADTRKIAQNNTEEGKEKNRRVEIKIKY